MQNALLISPVDEHARVLTPALRRLDFRLRACSRWEDALELGERDIELVLFCLGDLAGAERAEALRRVETLGAPTLVLGDSPDPAVDALAFPFLPAELEKAVRRLRSRRRAVPAADAPEWPLIGASAAFARVTETLRQAAATDATLLLQGESGTGKEVLARAAHAWSKRSRGPFIALNCAAMPDGLVESTLFGHERGAFTGAAGRLVGAFERADGGTLLLDEVSEMDISLQAKLLRAVQEMRFERLGGSETVSTDVRIIATTNRDLTQAVDEGRFREDLYYRLSVIPIVLPPLRERREDIRAIAEHYLVRAARASGKQVETLGPTALEVLLGHDWPGNVRELAHAVERAVVLASGPVLNAEDFLPEKRALAPWRKTPRTPKENVVAELVSYRLDEAERILIEQALEKTGGQRKRAAELLGISDRTLRNKLNGPGRSDQGSE